MAVMIRISRLSNPVRRIAQGYRAFLGAAILALGLGCDGGGYDIFEFVSCLAGPGSSTAIGCEGYNLDCDGNIDLADFAVIQSCTNGG